MLPGLAVGRYAGHGTGLMSLSAGSENRGSDCEGRNQHGRKEPDGLLVRALVPVSVLVVHPGCFPCWCQAASKPCTKLDMID